MTIFALLIIVSAIWVVDVAVRDTWHQIRSVEDRAPSAVPAPSGSTLVAPPENVEDRSRPRKRRLPATRSSRPAPARELSLTPADLTWTALDDVQLYRLLGRSTS